MKVRKKTDFPPGANFFRDMTSMDAEDVVDIQGRYGIQEAVDPELPEPSLLEDAHTDAQILSQYRSGQREAAFAEVYRLHGFEVMRHANYIARNMHDAEEVTQETFLRAFREFDSFRGTSQISTWLRRIADNLLIDRIRYGKRKGRDSVTSLEIVPDNLSASTPAHSRPDFIAVQREHRLFVEQCAEVLSEALRSVFVKRAFSEHSEQEVALELEVPIGTLKSRFNEGRKQVARCLKLKMGGVI